MKDYLDEFLDEYTDPRKVWETKPKPKTENQTIIALRAQIAQLKQTVQYAEGEAREYKRLASKLQSDLEYNLGRSTPNVIPIWIKKYIKFLIFACHPDRNSGKNEAVEVTKELLKLYRRK
jgi:hypothetical protein